MEFRDLVAKFYDENKSVKQTVVESNEVKTESNLPSLKKIFETLSENVSSGMKPFAILDPQNKSAGAAVVKSSNPAVQKMLGSLDPKDIQIVMTKTSTAPAAGQPAQSGVGTGMAAAVKEEQVEEKAKNPYAIGMAAAKKAAGITKKHATDLPKSVVVKGHEIAKKIKKKEKMDEGDIASTKSQDTMGAGLGAGRSNVALESLQVNESMNKKHRAAYQEGQADGLRERACRVKHYEDMEEAKHYYEGWKAGLDECYGMGVKQEPIVGMEEAVAAMEAGMGEGNAFTAALAKTDKGDTFKVGGSTYKDTSNYDAKVEGLAFESLDKQLNALLNEDVEETVNEGLSVSMSTGQQGSPDSVSVTGTDDEAGKLLAFIKQVGLGGMGGDKPMVGGEEPVVAVATSDYGAPKFAGHDNPDMKALLQKVGVGSEDYKDEEGHEHKHGEPCNECGMMEADCGCDKKESVMGEEQTEDQKLYATTESDDSEDDGFDASARNTELDNVGKPASGGATHEDVEGEEQLALGEDGAEAPGSNSVGQEEQEEAEKVNESEELTEWANNAGQKGTDTSFEQDIEFMTKVISGGLNKPKVTGQTTVPVIAGQDARDGQKEDLGSWIKLAGIKPAVKK